MKNILIKAYLHLNLGDDLFLKVLCERYPEFKFIVMYNKSYINIKGIESSNLHVKKNFFLNRVLKFISSKAGVKKDFYKEHILKNSLCHINIGGSLFQELNERWPAGYIERKMDLKLNREGFLLGANFGPYETDDYYEKHRDLFRGYRDVCFRDTSSYELFNHLPNIRKACDIVFNLRDRVGVIPRGEYILLSVINCRFRSRPDKLKKVNELYNEKIVEIVEHLVSRGEEVKLMSFCEYEGDEAAIEEVIKKVSEKSRGGITRYYYRGNMEEALEVINNSKFIVATRFHAMILAMIYEKPFFPLIYNKKMTNVLDDMGFQGRRGSLEEISRITVEEIFDNQKISTDLVDEIKRDSEKHFEGLDAFLTDKSEG